MVGWPWHLVAAELRQRNHDVVASDLPCDDDSTRPCTTTPTPWSTPSATARMSSWSPSGTGSFTAPRCRSALGAHAVVLVAGMVPAPGESGGERFDPRYRQAVEEQASRDGGLTGSDDPLVAFYHDVPLALAEAAISRERSKSAVAYNSPWPLVTWPDVPTRFVVCTEDRFFPAASLRRVVAEQLGIVTDRIAAGHCVALGRAEELGRLLDSYARADRRAEKRTPAAT